MIIGICDDDKRYRKELVCLCNEYIKCNNIECDIVEFSSGEEVLCYEGDKICLLFLDIEMEGMDGLEVMRCLEKTSLIWRIVFVTSHEECVWDSFGLKTLGFATKPIEYDKLHNWISVALRENGDRILIEFGTSGGCLYKYEDEIYYIKASGNYSTLYDGNKEILINDILKVWQEKLQDTSIKRIHKSYLVNFAYVRKVEYDKVIMQDGRKLKVGRLYRDRIKTLYKEYIYETAIRRI